MPSSNEDSSELLSRKCDDALVPPTEAGGKNNVERTSKRDNSPKNVTDVAGHSFQAGQECTGRHVKVNESELINIRPPPSEYSSRTNRPVSIVDESSLDTSSMISRVRARAAAKPKRYRQSTETELPTATATLNLPKPKKRASTESQQKKSTTKVVKPLIKRGGVSSTRKADRGAWTEKEQTLFEDGCLLHGWGNWKSIELMIPTRDRKQVKSHAQKFQKHHGEKKKELDLEHRRLVKVEEKVAEKIARGGTKKRKALDTAASPDGAVSSSKKRCKQDKQAVAMEPPVPKAASKRVSPTKESKPPTQNATHKRVPPIEDVKSPCHKTVSKPASPTQELKVSVRRAESKLAPPTTNVKPPVEKTLPKCVQPTEEVQSHTEKTDTPNPPVPENTHETESLRTEEKLDDQRKRARAITPKCGLPPRTKKGRRVFHDSDTPGAGSWTSVEHLQFEKGCLLHGWGNWKAIESCVPTRTTIQIKSHAQKIRKHRPADKERLEREHKLYADLADNEDLARGRSKSKKKSAAKRLPPLKNRRAKAHLRGQELARKGEWSLTEKKQFEDGCIFHGWGNWDDVASHVHTKNVSQVCAHAETYHLEDEERLKREHTLNYPEVDGEASEEETLMDTDNIKVHHILLGMGGKKTEINKPTPPPKVSTQRTTVDDYGAAEAIMALNFANWDNRRDKKKKEEYSFGLDDPQTAPSAEAVSESSQDDDMSADAHESEDDVEVRSKKITFETKHCQNSVNCCDLKNLSTAIPEANDAAAKTSEDVDVRVDSQEDKAIPTPKNTVNFELTIGGGLNRQDSKSFTETTASVGKEDLSLSSVEDFRDEFPEDKGDAVDPINGENKSQPPPHWLATDTWDECLGNIHRWNKELTKSEKNLEYLSYNHLSGKEKERLRLKLVILMNNQPIGLHPSAP
mmetsp:Transcript_5901/g.14783  ORF Transcript_5901/g.14783 Transcript_5901/m.14783 type:complete len:915 (-) Transcript_5901:132-2876(-)